MMKRRYKYLIALTAGVTLLAVAAPNIVPAEVEAKYNRVHHAQKPIGTSLREQHQQLIVADLHDDSLLWSRNLSERAPQGHVDIPRLLEGNVKLQGFTVVTQSPKGQNSNYNTADTDRLTPLLVASGWPPKTWDSFLERALHQAQRLQKTAEADERLILLHTQKDLARALNTANSVGGFLGLEGMHALEGKLEHVDTLYKAGFRMLGITHFIDNAFGASAHGVSKAGLSPLGEKAIARMETLGITVDLAHASPQLIEDILKRATKPVVVSHTGVKGTCKNNRNLDDKHLQLIAQNGGVVGIGFWSIAVCGKDITDIANAMAYTARKIGAQHVALGSDFDGSVSTPIDASGIPLLTQALLDQGLSHGEVKLIMGENVLRILQQNLPQN